MLLQCLKQDFSRNGVSLKSTFLVLFFRFSGWFALHPCLIVRLIGLPVRLLYKVIVEIIMGVELPDRVVAGPGLAIFHGVGLVVNAGVKIGQNVTLRQNTTIGSKVDGGPVPKIGDNVSIGANSVLIGNIDVGENSAVGAGVVLSKSCPAGSKVYGPKALIVGSSQERN